jgi:hypothetical protein
MLDKDPGGICYTMDRDPSRITLKIFLDKLYKAMYTYITMGCPWAQISNCIRYTANN